MDTHKLRSAAAVLGHPRERVYQCEDCKTALDQPVDKSGLYILRDNEPLLICPKCALPDDLFIWGDITHLNHQDWTSDMLKAETEKEQALIAAEVMKTEMEKMQVCRLKSPT